MSDGGQQELGAGQAAQPQLEREEEVREGECSTRGLGTTSWGLRYTRGTAGVLGEGRSSAGLWGPGSV